jgi:hypothetical protein
MLAPNLKRATFLATFLASTAWAADPHPLLVELPVTGMKLIAPAEYGAASALAASGGSPLDIALRIVGEFEGAEQHIVQVNDGGEAPSSSQITVLRDGLMDDSVRGERWDIALNRTSAGTWKIGMVKWAWRCRRGEFPDRFATVSCP